MVALLSVIAAATSLFGAAGANANTNANAEDAKEVPTVSEPFKYGETEDGAGAQCFCKLEGQIDDCACDVDTVDHFNNARIHPRLMSLLSKPYFRYFRYNAHKPCPFWREAGKCASENCYVRNCQEEEIPPGLKGERPASAAAPSNHNKYSEEATNLGKCDDDEELEEDSGKVDDTLSAETRADLAEWQAHDDREEAGKFCDVDDAEPCPDCDFVDLALNPERYTGYSGEASHQIWRAIYEENCFRPPSAAAETLSFSEAFLQDSLDELCLEKRAFYRAVSGLHSSITIHLCANYLLDGSSKDSPFAADGGGRWGPNLEEFERRFDPLRTNGQGPYWLRNLYFVYLLELRALTKVGPYLERQDFYTGREEEDKETRIAVKELLSLMRTFPDHFDESAMFVGGGAALKAEFREHFRNISRIMDCVSCAKCRLWGKLQVTGLGTALKILFADEGGGGGDAGSLDRMVMLDSDSPSSRPAAAVDADNFRLTRNEIVALFNAFGRISTSIHQLERFRKKLT